MKPYKISIIGNGRNEGQYVKETLDHIVKETDYPSYEIILIDDGSTDESFSYIKPSDYAVPVKIIRNEQSIGFAKSRNLGARESSGEYLVFIDCHIFPTKNWLQELVKAVNLNEGGMSVIKIISLKSNDPIHEGTHTYIFNDYFLNPNWQYEPNQKEIYEVPLACGCSYLIRRDIFDKIKGYTDEFIRVGREDTELCFKNCLLGYKIYSSPNALVKHYFKETWGSGFAISYPVIHNALAFGYLHFTEKNFYRMINTCKHYPYFANAFYAVINNENLMHLRSYYKSIFKYDDQWFFEKFSKYTDQMNTNYRSLYANAVDPIFKRLISQLFSENQKLPILDNDFEILDFKNETSLSNEDLKILITSKFKL